MLRTSGGSHLSAPWALVFLPLFVLAGTARSEERTKAYVTHSGAGLVTSIDTAADAVAGTLAAGTGPSKVAITRDGTRAYVANGGSDSVSVIDTATDTVTDLIPVGDGPSALAVTPDGQRLYVMTASGAVEVVDTAQRAVVAAIPVGAAGDIAITPDGSRAYVAAGLVYVIDTAANVVVRSFAAEQAPLPDVTNNATAVAISPDGRRAYVGVVTFNFADTGFSAGGSVVLVDTASESVIGAINLFAAPGSIAFTPDGSRAYVGIQAFWANTGYGAAFLPGRSVYVVDTAAGAIVGVIDLGAEFNTAAGIGVTPDRRAVYVAIPRIGVVAVADVNANSVIAQIPVTAGPGPLAVVPDPTAAPVPYKVDAVDDAATVSTAGGTAVANVLANDRFAGTLADLAHLTVTQVSSTSDGIALDSSTGAVAVAAGTALGDHSLVYRICEKAASENCDEATVTVTVRVVFVIDAVDDAAVTLPGRAALANVLANDSLEGLPATTARVTLSVVSSTHDGIQLHLGTGSVFVRVGTPPGPQTLTYRICEIASPINCDTADVALTVNPFPIDAVNDTGSAPRSGGTAVVNVLANDTFAGATAALARVALSQVASSNGGIALDATTGAVRVAAGTPVGAYRLDYRICEIATPSNCDEATVAVTVLPLPITAVNDSGRGSSKVANTVVANVLANDRLGGTAATPANVRLSFVSLTPANSKIRLDLADGSVDVLGKTSSGLYSLVYEICEAAVPTNCARATVNIDLSGGL